MQLFRLALAVASSALAFKAAAEGNIFTAIGWTVAAVVWLVMITAAEDRR
ncbi:hypothetical protein [Streptomyces cyaneofuscatus]|nr:hypothetical protein OG323_22660 [Streptomyces cyaneofuscatus]